MEKQFFFNKVGVLAWYVANTLGGQKALKPWQLRLYGELTPIFRVLDEILPTSGPLDRGHRPQAGRRARLDDLAAWRGTTDRLAFCIATPFR